MLHVLLVGMAIIQASTPGLNDLRVRAASLASGGEAEAFQDCPSFEGLGVLDIERLRVDLQSPNKLDALTQDVASRLAAPAFQAPAYFSSGYAEAGLYLSNEDQALRSFLHEDSDAQIALAALCRTLSLAAKHLETGLATGAFLETIEHGQPTEIGALTLLVVHQTDRGVVARAAASAAESEQVHPRVKATLLDFDAQLRTGRQLYGSYLSCFGNQVRPDPPLFRPQGVDARREQLGLQSTLAEAIAAEAVWLCSPR